MMNAHHLRLLSKITIVAGAAMLILALSSLAQAQQRFKTPEEAVEALKEHVEALKDQPITVKVESLYDAIEDIKGAEKKGIEFSDQPVLEPESVL